MKKLAIITLSLVLLLSGYANALPLFEVVDTTYSVYDKIRLNIEYTNGESEYLEIEYSNTSDKPIKSLIEGVPATGTDFRVASFVGRGYLSSEIVAWPGSSAENGISYYDGQSRTKAWTETVFQPKFNGGGPMLTFYHTAEYPYDNNEFSIIDNTLGIEIFNPGWEEVPDDELRMVTFDYMDWDLSHTYTLRMALSGSTNSEGHHNYITGSDFYSYVKIPEPSTMFICVLVLIGMCRIRNRYCQNTR